MMTTTGDQSCDEQREEQSGQQDSPALEQLREKVREVNAQSAANAQARGGEPR